MSDNNRFTQNRDGSDTPRRTRNRNKSLNYSTKNISFDSIGRKIENANIILTRSFDEIDEFFTFEHVANTDYDRLKMQADVFATALIGEIFDKRYVFGTRDNYWKERASRIYIYSYYRAICYGQFSFMEDELDTNYFLFSGHAVFGESLRAQRFSGITAKGNVIQQNLSLGFDLESEIPKIETNFPFLKDCFQERSNSRWFVSNFNCDNWLSRLSDQGLSSISLVELRSRALDVRKFIDPKLNPFGNSADRKSVV